MFTVVVPCYNEEQNIRACLQSIVDQVGLERSHGIEVVVVLNGCTDGTYNECASMENELRVCGFAVRFISLARPNKANALNVADSSACWPARLYMDADVQLSPGVLAALAPLLKSEDAVYCSGTLECSLGCSRISLAYSRIWCSLPFIKTGVAGIGLYGVSAQGRRRWGVFPDLHSDDRFVRLHFRSTERMKVPQTYVWPVPDGFVDLVRVRRRWSEGNRQLFYLFPHLRKHDDKKHEVLEIGASLLRAPLSASVFVLIWFISYVLAMRKDPSQPVVWYRRRSA